MNEIKDTIRSVNPRAALLEITGAIPAGCKKNLIIIGSLAVGFHYEDQIRGMAIRTKDADCLLSPRVEAVNAGRAITEQLLQAGWRLKQEGEWTKPGNSTTPDNELPAVRLYSPKSNEWFIELLMVPESSAEPEKRWVRLKTRHGHFGLPSFGYLSLTSFEPLGTNMGIFVARPEMMVLANMLEHLEISPERMSGLIAGRSIKRSNKDLGRVLAIVYLSTMQDEDAILEWPKIWCRGLQDNFSGNWREKATSAGSGIRQLLIDRHESDQEEALHTCVNGLLASIPPTMDQLRVAGERLLVDAIEPLEKV